MREYETKKGPPITVGASSIALSASVGIIAFASVEEEIISAHGSGDHIRTNFVTDEYGETNTSTPNGPIVYDGDN